MGRGGAYRQAESARAATTNSRARTSISFAESLRSKAPPWERDYAIAGVEALDAAARRWVEDCLWHTLPTDPRAARALASLHVRRALAPLREALPLANGETAKAIEEAIATLE